MTDQTVSPHRLGLLGAIMLIGSNMIGSGIYMLPATLGAVGSISLLSWLIAGAGAIFLALVFGFLGVLRPDSHGVVTYAGEALHPALGHVSWFVYWLGCWISNSAVTVGLVGYLGYFIPALKDPTISVVGCLIAVWALSIANMVGPKLVARIGGATLMIGLVPVLMATGVGLMAFSPDLFHASWNVSGKPEGIAMSGAVTPIFFAFLGLEGGNIAARVISDPRRNLPIAAIGGVLVAGTIYIAASAAIMGLLPAARLATSTAPFADAIVPVVGAVAAGLVALCAFAKTTGTLGAGILFAAESQRSGVAAGFMPRVLSDPKSHNPTREILLTGLLSSLAILATASSTLGGQFLTLINVTVVLSLIFYLLCALSLLRLSTELPKPSQRFASRLAAALAALFCLWVMATTDASLRIPALGVVGVSLGLWAVGRGAARLRPPQP